MSTAYELLSDAMEKIDKVCLSKDAPVDYDKLIQIKKDILELYELFGLGQCYINGYRSGENSSKRGYQ